MADYRVVIFCIFKESSLFLTFHFIDCFCFCQVVIPVSVLRLGDGKALYSVLPDQGVILVKPSSVMSAQKLALLLADFQKSGKKIVFTNGCFDLLHSGHVSYLATARALGDLLVVGVNSDASVRRLKGKKRPIMPEEARAQLLAALACVDYVTIFDEDDPYQLISLLQPNILVKGGDWDTSSIVGRDLVEARGGKVCSLPFIDEYSTTSIVEEIIRRYT